MSTQENDAAGLPKGGSKAAAAMRDALVREYPILKHFGYEHLPEKLRAASRPFCFLAFDVAQLSPCTDKAERVTALRKLLEGKDAAVRSVL